MATLYGSNATLRDVSVPPTRIAGVDNGAKVLHMFDSFTYAAAPTTSDVIKMMKLPAGARVINVILSATAATAGAVNVGWEASSAGDAASASGFFAALSVASATTKSMADTTANAAGQGVQFAGEVQVSIVPSTTFTATSGTVKLHVIYALA